MRTAQRTEFAFRDSDFQTVVRLVREQTGIVLGDHKRDLVYGRLSKRLRAMGMEDFAGYCELVESEEGVAERRQMVNAITTNLTGFFREPHHFEFLGSTVLAALKRDKQTTQRRLRLWSAGCSSGEEPYSIAMILRDSLAHEAAGWDARILATDIDTDVLARARSGLYDEERADAADTVTDASRNAAAENGYDERIRVGTDVVRPGRDTNRRSTRDDAVRSLAL